MERTIRYLRDSFFAARTLQRAWRTSTRSWPTWMSEVALVRRLARRRPTGRRVVEVLERRASHGCCRCRRPPSPRDVVRPVASGKTPYVRFDGNDYSMPHTLVQKPLTLVASETARPPARRRPARWPATRAATTRAARVETPAHLAALAAAEAPRAQSCAARDVLRASLQARRRPSSTPSPSATCSVGHHTAQLTRLLRAHGARDVDAALAEALRQGRRERRLGGAPARPARARGASSRPPLHVVLPDDPRIARLPRHPALRSPTTTSCSAKDALR